MKSCFSINVFMPDVIMEYGNQVFDSLKQDVKFSKHFNKRAEERDIQFEDISSYSVCELYFDGMKIKDIAIYRRIGNEVIVAYISVNSKSLKTIYKLNEYTFLNGGRNSRFNETVPVSLYGLFHTASASIECDENRKLEIMNLSNVMKREMKELMDNFDNMSDTEILKKIEKYNKLWKQKKYLKGRR